MNMKQNAALEMFEYLKEHLIPLAKDKGDKVYESDTTVQIARPENKSCLGMTPDTFLLDELRTT